MKTTTFNHIYRNSRPTFPTQRLQKQTISSQKTRTCCPSVEHTCPVYSSNHRDEPRPENRAKNYQSPARHRQEHPYRRAHFFARRGHRSCGFQRAHNWSVEESDSDSHSRNTHACRLRPIIKNRRRGQQFPGLHAIFVHHVFTEMSTREHRQFNKFNRSVWPFWLRHRALQLSHAIVVKTTEKSNIHISKTVPRPVQYRSKTVPIPFQERSKDRSNTFPRPFQDRSKTVPKTVPRPFQRPFQYRSNTVPRPFQ